METATISEMPLDMCHIKWRYIPQQSTGRLFEERHQDVTSWRAVR